MNKSENKINFFIVLIIIIAVIIVAFIFLKKNYTNQNVIKLSIADLKQKIDNNESFIMVITQDTCSHCHAFLPVLNKVGSQYNVTFYEVSQTNLSDDDYTYLKNVANISGTPTTVFIENGKEKSTLNRLEGEVQEYRLVEKLKNMGYIHE